MESHLGVLVHSSYLALRFHLESSILQLGLQNLRGRGDGFDGIECL